MAHSVHGMTGAGLALVAGLLAMVPASAAEASAAEKGLVASIAVERPYAEVRQGLEDAIINRGYNIDYNAHIGDMLERTAADVGATRQVYLKAEALQFCSAVLSRQAMEADPANIAFCPYVLFVYEDARSPGQVTVGFRKLAETGSDASIEAIAAINDVLSAIIEEAADGF